jgi:hypothetical protein
MLLPAQMICVLILPSTLVYTLAYFQLIRNNSYYYILPICSITYGKCYKFKIQFISDLPTDVQGCQSHLGNIMHQV